MAPGCSCSPGVRVRGRLPVREARQIEGEALRAARLVPARRLHPRLPALYYLDRVQEQLAKARTVADGRHLELGTGGGAGLGCCSGERRPCFWEGGSAITMGVPLNCSLQDDHSGREAGPVSCWLCLAERRSIWLTRRLRCSGADLFPATPPPVEALSSRAGGESMPQRSERTFYSPRLS